MSLRRNDKGFGIVGILLVLVVLGAITAVGTYVYMQKDKKDDKQSNNITNFEECKAAGYPIAESYPEQCHANGQVFVNESQKPLKVPVDETADWLEYKTNGYSVRIADGLTMKKGEAKFIFTHEEVKLVSGTKAKIVPLVGGSDNPHILFFQFEKPGEGTLIRGDRSEFTNPNGVKIERYVFTQTTEPEGIDIAKGSKEYVYIATKNKKAAQVRYAFRENGNVELVEKMVNTLDIE